MTSVTRPRVLLVAICAAVVVPVTPLTAGAAGDTATVYIVQGVADSRMAVTVDGTLVAGDAAAKAVIGPLTLSAGQHTVSAKNPSGSAAVSATVTLTAGTSVDTVLHRQVDPSKPPAITVFPNDLSPVVAGNGRLVVAHTATVGPADVRVNQKVLFANIASGEALTLTVPAGTYPVDIVPNATTGPVVLGPVDLPVGGNALTRVFAIGVAATSSMDAIVQVLPLATQGAGMTPSGVPAGDGGQAVALMAGSDGSDRQGLIGLVGVLGAAVVALAAWLRRRPAKA